MTMFGVVVLDVMLQAVGDSHQGAEYAQAREGRFYSKSFMRPAVLA